ncbi:hypothetical protein [Mesorhizobium sp. ISC11]|uniref:hypothetical protein n=1 Tax=Mesorhizobium sp. ISC11 TaxID=3076428 RepID=UPI00301E5A3D
MGSKKKNRLLPPNSTLATRVSQLDDPIGYVFSVWSKMRFRVHEVRLILNSDPRWPDYALYESMDDPQDPSDENDYGPTMLMCLVNGKTHELYPNERWDEDYKLSDAWMNWQQVSYLYGELVP